MILFSNFCSIFFIKGPLVYEIRHYFSIFLCFAAGFLNGLLCLELAVVLVCLEVALKTYCVATFVSYNTEIVPNPK
jgi:hypothetical protein